MNPARTLQTPRLQLRLPVARDLPVYTAFATSARAKTVGGPFETAQAFDKLAAMIGHWELRGWGRYVIELDGRAIGHCGPLDTFGGTPEMTWTLWDATAMGQGFATEAVQEVIRHLFDDCGWSDVKICIDPANDASHRMAQRIGAQAVNVPGPARWPEAKTYTLTRKAA
ncbi:GNAT family N-acetyltransferase [uncultured Pelagimonas sp.]|uniref:GNAT family N-acetyltransferase n=1 Tax=uncultured Pelagimonas sp. TaxID=1618102 RepID=UPI002627A097|nr:GNAT family N-acetyltransferase [uncultured Pelagimonas sp.]